MAVVPPPSSRRTVGAAMVMTVLSSRSMISATSTTASTTQRQRYGGASAGGAGSAVGTATAVADMRGSVLDREARGLRTLFVTNTVRNEHRSCQAIDSRHEPRG